jgi:hypothetical protein
MSPVKNHSTAEEIQLFNLKDNSSQPNVAQSPYSNEHNCEQTLGDLAQLDGRTIAIGREEFAQKSRLRRVYSKIVKGHEYAEIGPLQPDSHRRAWRAGIKWVTFGATVIFILNIGITIFVAARYPISNGTATLYKGSCKKISLIDSGLHIVINILSTAFLSASNFVMQILNAPSRTQVLKRHYLGKSFDIGILSFRNAVKVGWLQGSLWFLLGVSAIPLHLLQVFPSCFY